MNKVYKGIYIVTLVLFCGIATNLFADDIKWLRVNKVNMKAVDSGSMHESIGGSWGAHVYNHFDDFQQASVQSRGWHFGAQNFTDEDGTTWPVKIAGGGGGGFDEIEHTIPVPDDEGITIHRYFRDPRPAISVDGFELQEPFPLKGDAINPEKTGTADVMAESWIRTSLGLEIHQKMYAWSQKNHDDYIVYDWVVTNTGNIDLDEEIELDQTLDSLYFGRAMHHYNMGMWDPWYSHYGEFQTDTLRLSYSYPKWTDGANYDDFGGIDEVTGYPRDALALGEAVLFVSETPNAVTAPADDADQGPPGWSMTGYHSNELKIWKQPTSQTSEEDWQTLYRVMNQGWVTYDGEPTWDPNVDNVWPDGHYKVDMDVRAEQESIYDAQLFQYRWHPNNHYALGPWDLPQGDSIRIVWAEVIGTMSPENAWDVGTRWKDGELTEDPTLELPPMSDYVYSENSDWTENDIGKDQLVYSIVDSLFRNAGNAEWLVDQNYNVPIPPPAPSVTVTSEPDQIVVEWGDESENPGHSLATPVAGYNVYRAIGNPGPTVQEGNFFGSWELMQTFDAADEHRWTDENAERGQAYYYYVAAFNDGNPAGVTGTSETLESGLYLNRTIRPASLKRAPGVDLEAIRVVPNPWNINARDLQYTGEPNKINFLNLPGECTIKIFSESGDLIQTIEHVDGSGDESWGALPEEQQTTRSGQRIVSGIYIAVIETPEGDQHIEKFVVVR